MKRLAIVAVGLALVVGATTGCHSSRYSKAEVDSTVAAAQTARVDLTGSTGWIADATAYAPDVGMVYMQNRDDPYKLFRVSVADLSYTYYTAPTGHHYGCAAVVTGDYLYLTYTYTGSPPAHTRIARFPISWDLTGTSQAETFDAGAYGESESMDTDGTYLYVGTIYSKLVKVRISDMVTVAHIDFHDSYPFVPPYPSPTDTHSIRVDDTYVFANVHSTLAGRVARVVKSDLSDVTWTAELSPGVVLTDDMAMTADYIYGGYDAPAEGKVVKVKKSDMSFTIITCGSGVPMDGLAEEPGGEYVWIGWSTQPPMPGQLTRLKVSDDLQKRFWLADNETYLNEILMCPDQKTMLLVVGTATSMSVVKLTDLMRRP